MDVFNKLRSTVTSTVSQFSGVLPGNPVTREYEVVSHTCSAGPGLLWKVYQGFKKSTKQEVSVFVFEKRLLDKYPRECKESVLDLLKSGISQLTKLRHPQVLTIQHPLEESRESLAFATEPVFSSLANILGHTENTPPPLGVHLKDFKLYNIEIKYGLLQIAEGLAFLHSDVKLLHGNISPESIVINQQGAWKIFGFDFCLHGELKQEGQLVWPSVKYSHLSQNVIQPNLDYLAPEVGLSQSKVSPSADVFSLGMLIYALYNSGRALNTYNDDWNYYKKKINELKNIQWNALANIPDGLQELVKLMLQMAPELRPDAHQLQKIEFFEDIGVKTLNYLDSLFQWEKQQKSIFYKGLPPVIKNFPHRVCLHRVVPCLAKEFANSCMVPFILPSVFQIAETCTQTEYMTHIFPHLQVAMKMNNPIQITIILLQKMELLLKFTPPEEVKTDVLPVLYRAFDSNVPEIEELCLSVFPTFSGLVDYSAMKNSVLPRIKKICIKTNQLSVRVNSLVCIGKLLDNLDKWLVLDEILPFLQEIPSREPAVLMGILGIYKIALTHKKLGIPKDIIATKVVPFLMPFTIENGLTLNQFNTLFTVLRDMINRVETEHRSKIEQLSAISQETSSLTPSSSTKMEMFNQGENEVKSDLESIFSSQEIPKEKSVTSAMENNQRPLKQQEILQKFMEDFTVTCPKPAPAPTPTKKEPEDFTDILFQWNFNEMKLSPNLTPQPSSMLSPMQTPKLNPQTPKPNFNPNAWTQPSSFNTPFMGNLPPVNKSQSPMDMNFINNSVTSMHSMNTVNTMNFSLLPPTQTFKPNNNPQQPVKSLTKSEINDLLSEKYVLTEK